MLTVAQKTLVQDSFATIAPIADDAAALFYGGCSSSIPRCSRCSAATWPSSARS